jgi:hypothetical protein
VGLSVELPLGDNLCGFFTLWYRHGSGLENRDYGLRYPSHWPRGTLYPQKLALASPTSGGRSVGIVYSGTQATEFVCFLFIVMAGCLGQCSVTNKLQQCIAVW